MLEPFLMLTVLNCFFMFSSTVTTCALWWQTRRHRHSCHNHDEATKLNDHLGSKSSVKKRDKSDSRAVKESKRNKKTKSSSLPVKFAPQEEKDETPKTLEKLTSTEEMKQGATSPSSDAKSTIVMEVSTVQKVVQIIEHDRDNQQGHMPKGTLTCRFSPESERKFKFLVRSRSEERSKATEDSDYKK